MKAHKGEAESQLCPFLSTVFRWRKMANFTRRPPKPRGKNQGRGQLKCDGTGSETRFRLSAKRTSPFKSAGGASVQSTTDSRGVRISGSNAGYTMFRGSLKGTGYPLHSQVSPFTSPPPVRHRVPSLFNWTLPSPVYFIRTSKFHIKIV